MYAEKNMSLYDENGNKSITLQALGAQNNSRPRIMTSHKTTLH